MKPVFFISLFIIFAMHLFAQQQTFDVVSFTALKGWQQQQNEGGVQLSVTNQKSEAYALAIITKATMSNASANENFTADWNKLVKGTVKVQDEPTMQTPTKENGWDVISGSANYTDGGSTGMATLLTATGGGQMVSVVLMTNTKQYQNDLLTLLNSLQLAKVASSTVTVTMPATTNNTNGSSVVGLWCYNILETSGYANGFPQYTAGYFRKEYLFKNDGTYIFRQKNWSVYQKEILFVYESGTYSVNGNQLTVTPAKGKGGWWNKKDNSNKLWGSQTKSSDYKAEKVTYAFETKYYSGSKDYVLILKAGKETQREGTANFADGVSYSLRANGESIIDNPPGFKN